MAIRESRGGEGCLRKEKREKGTGERKEGALVKRGVRERLTVRDCFGLKERELPKAKKGKGKGKKVWLVENRRSISFVDYVWFHLVF